MVIALVALGTAATFTIIDGVNTSNTTPTSQSRSIRDGNNMMPQMDGEAPEAPADDDGNIPPEMPNDESQDNTNTTPQTPDNSNRQNRNRRSDAETDTEAEETTSLQLTNVDLSAPITTELAATTTDTQNSNNNHALISYLLVGTKFFAIGAIVAYLLLSRFNSYSPKEVIKK